MNKKNVLPWVISVGIFILVILLWFLLGGGAVGRIEDRIEGYLESEGTSRARLAARQEAVVSSVGRVKAAVVSIALGEANTAGFSQGLHKSGSGVVITPGGFIITALKNIGDASDVKVVIFEVTHYERGILEEGHHHIFDAAVAGTSPELGLALLKITPSGSRLPYAVLGDSQNFNIGDHITSIGNPLEKRPAATSGVVTSLGETKNIGGTPVRGLFRITNRGGSDFIGGPVVDKNGAVAGIIVERGYAAGSGSIRGFLNARGVPRP